MEKEVVVPYMPRTASDTFVNKIWHNRFMDLAKQISTWSTCRRNQCGAVIIRDKRIITTGYNGAPSGLLECNKGRECIREKLGVPSGERHELCVAVHAEQNALVQAARLGISVKGASMYVTTQPCSLCTKLIINAGISDVYYTTEYPDPYALELFAESTVEVHKL